MNADDFRASPIGTLRRIQGQDRSLGRDYDHFAYVPAALPSGFDLAQKTYKLVSEAERAIGRLDAAVVRVPNPGLLVRPALYREAASTSALEGTYAPLADVLEADFLDEREQSYEVREIRNVIRATDHALDLLQRKPICQTVLHELQALLVRGTRSDGATAGALRLGQVYIGEQRSGIEKSRFVPPPPGPVLVQGMNDWEKWINAEDDIPLVVKIAMGHYQFESWHPYTDGNGRLGRLVIVMQLVEAKALTLTYPLLDFSSWLAPRKAEYKDHLLNLSKTGLCDPFIQFVAEGLIESAQDGVRRIERLSAVREELTSRLKADQARGVALDIVDDLIGTPYITASKAAERHGVTFPPANRAIQRMVKLGILEQVTERSYGRIYVCREVLRAVDE